jgi:hypothetical protein
MKDRRVLVGAVIVVIAVWLVGAAVTKYSLEQMAYFAPIAMVVVGATVALVLLWVKIVLQLRDDRRERNAKASPRSGR